MKIKRSNIKVVSQKQKYFWNMAGSLCNALSTVVLLLLVNRILGNKEGGVFSFAYANAQMLMTVGGFEVRPIQSTDVEEEYPFQTYFTLRAITCFLMLLIGAVYVYCSNLEKEKTWVLIAFTLFKMLEAFTDVFAGMYQQKDRIDMAGKSFSLRVILSTVAFMGMLLSGRNLFWAAFAMVAVSFTLIFVYDRYLMRMFPEIKIGFSFKNMGTLIKNAIPLFLATFIMSYITNAPKYAIDAYCSDILQNKYSILIMPASVINLFSLFIFRPALVDMAKRWKGYDIEGIVHYISKMTICIFVLAIICVVGGITVGIPVLSRIYGVDLKEEKLVLALAMVYGGLNALVVYFYYVITVMRTQKKMLIGYVSAFALTTIMSPFLVNRMDLLGAVITSIVTVFVLAVIFGIIICLSIKKHRQRRIVCSNSMMKQL